MEYTLTTTGSQPVDLEDPAFRPNFESGSGPLLNLPLRFSPVIDYEYAKEIKKDGTSIIHRRLTIRSSFIWLLGVLVVLIPLVVRLAL